MKTPIQTTSRKCQNIDRHIRRRRLASIRPNFQTCTISVTSQIRPQETCRPWVPTRVKKAYRKALRWGVAPSWIMWANSVSSMPMKARPNRPVIASHICVWAVLFCCIVSIAKP